MPHPLILLSACASVLYFGTHNLILKGLAVALLAAWVARSSLARRERWLLASALAFGSLGDVLLAASAALFAAGLGAFLIGHFLYILLFWTGRPKPSRLPLVDTAMLVALALFAGAMSLYLLPSTGSLAPAVAVYMGALTGMVALSLVRQLPERWVFLGALLFMISDTVLAVGKFKAPLPMAEWIIWPTYYVGQLMIAVGYLRARHASLAS